MYATLDGEVRHFHNGIPYTEDGSVVIRNLAGAAHHYHQGLPYDANSKLIRIGGNPTYFGSGAAPFQDTRLSTVEGSVAHIANGVAYSDASRVTTVAGPVPPPELGPELLRGGNFNTPKDWAIGIEWAVNYGSAKSVAGSGSLLKQEPPELVEGKTYRMQFHITRRDAGAVTPRVMGTAGASATSAGKYSQDIVAGASGPTGFNSNAAFQGILDSASLKEVLNP